MRNSPSIVPKVDGRARPLPISSLGKAWPEADADRRVIAFNIAEGWCRDVSEEIANELADLIAIDGRDVPTWLEDFIEEHVGSRPIQLPLPPRGAA